MLKRNRLAADPAGWTFAMMEWGSTWLLLQRGGRVQKEDLKSAYDGTLFWRLKAEREEREKTRAMGEEWKEKNDVGVERGYGLSQGWRDAPGVVRRWWSGRGLVSSFAEEVEKVK